MKSLIFLRINSFKQQSYVLVYMPVLLICDELCL